MKKKEKEESRKKRLLFHCSRFGPASGCGSLSHVMIKDIKSRSIGGYIPDQSSRKKK
jgi:hypothetical protein